jgi:hypothetical protein
LYRDDLIIIEYLNVKDSFEMKMELNRFDDLCWRISRKGLDRNLCIDITRFVVIISHVRGWLFNL